MKEPHIQGLANVNFGGSSQRLLKAPVIVVYISTDFGPLMRIDYNSAVIFEQRRLSPAVSGEES
jgi:hypothetical protein